MCLCEDVNECVLHACLGDVLPAALLSVGVVMSRVKYQILRGTFCTRVFVLSVRMCVH